MRRPAPFPFLAAEPGDPTPEAQAVIVGLATDGGVSFRPGAVEAPAKVREFSDSIETWSQRAKRDLDDLSVVDAGDVSSREEIAAEVDALVAAAPRALLVSIGGDHSVTPPTVGAVAKHHSDLAVVGFDAHLDLREDYPGDHACTYRYIADRGVPCFVFGPRSGARTEWEDVPKVLSHYSLGLEMPPSVRTELAGRPVYVTIDIDVLDPSVAPGTGTPEAGGPGFNELLEAIEALQGLDVVACDVVEIAPPLDPSGITQALGALLVRELILRFA